MPRQQVSQLGRGSLQDTISATPQDTGVAQNYSTDNKLGQLANALQPFSNAFSNVAGQIFEDNVRRDTQEQLAKFREAEAKNKGDFKQAVKDGTISFGANPWVRKSVRRAFAADQANKARTEFLGQLSDPQSDLYGLDQTQLGARFDAHMAAHAESFGLDINDGDAADGFLDAMTTGRQQAMKIVKEAQNGVTALQAEESMDLEIQEDAVAP